MPVSKPARLIIHLVVLSLLVPSVPSPPASGGSAWTTAGPELDKGTVVNSTLTPQGIRLPVNETYINNWTRVDPWPEGRTNPALVYDSRDGLFILFGGENMYSTRAFNDTWTYDLGTNAWTEKHPVESPPAGDGLGRGMVYDS